MREREGEEEGREIQRSLSYFNGSDKYCIGSWMLQAKNAVWGSNLQPSRNTLKRHFSLKVINSKQIMRYKTMHHNTLFAKQYKIF